MAAQDPLVRLEQEIKTVEGEIKNAEEKAEKASSEKDQDYWRQKESQLRQKESQLRQKESQLRQEKLQRQGSEQITREDIPDYLDKEFSQAYSRNQVRQRSRKENNPRKEEIRPQNARLSQIGQKFCLSNTTHLLRQLVGSLRELQWTSDNIERLEKFETTLQLLRIVASPGLGKTTAEIEIWSLLQHYVEQELRMRQIDTGGSVQSSASVVALESLLQRIKNSFSYERHLAFHMELQKRGLDVWYPQEERNEAFALAMRLLFSTLDLDQQEDAYPFFLDSHGSRLQNLNSWDVLQFIMRQSGILAGEKCMVAFCIDEVNRVARKAGDGPGSTWFQRLSSQFVELRRFAAQVALTSHIQILPVLVVASTRASLASFTGTKSGNAKVEDLSLPVLSIQDLQEIVSNLVKRTQAENKPSLNPFPPQLSLALSWLGGNPRFLAWALASLSGIPSSRLDEGDMRVGSPAFAWLTEPFSCALLIDDLLYLARQYFEVWLDAKDEAAHIAMTQAFSFSVVCRKIARQSFVPGTQFTWQALEADGLIYPRLKELQASLQAAFQADMKSTEQVNAQEGPVTRSRSNLAGGKRPSKAQKVSWDIEISSSSDSELDEDEARLYKEASDAFASQSQSDEAERNPGRAEPDSRADYVVVLPNLLAAAASKQLQRSTARILPPPLVAFLHDDWRSREETDCMILILRLCLLRKVFKEETVLLKDLFSGLACSSLGNAEVSIPEEGFRIVRVTEQIQSNEFISKMFALSEDQWAFIGPGNSGPDAWLILRRADQPGKVIVIFIQSKVRAISASVSEPQIEEEREKAFKVPKRFGETTQILVTDHSCAPLPASIETFSGESILVGVESHDSWYGPVAFLKAALAKDRLLKTEGSSLL